MQTYTHNYWAKKWTNLDATKIRQINASIDNPTQISNKVQRETQQKSITGYRNPFDILELGRHSGHRQQGHDTLHAMFTGYQIGGVEGARAGLIHIMLDKLSDNWKKNYGGARARDAIEAVMAMNRYE